MEVYHKNVRLADKMVIGLKPAMASTCYSQLYVTDYHHNHRRHHQAHSLSLRFVMSIRIEKRWMYFCEILYSGFY